MAIDFNEQEEGSKTKLATCSQHGLKYNPAVTWGCVLCRTNRKKRISGLLIVGILAALVIGTYYLVPVIYPKGEPQMSAMVSVGDSSSDSESPEAAALACRLELSKQVEKCIAKISPNASNVRMEHEFCLNHLKEPGTKCGSDFTPQDYLTEPMYKIGSLPPWTSVRAVIEESQMQIEECVDDRSYGFSARLMVNARNGKVEDVTLSLFGLNTNQRFCLYKYFESLQFPTCSGSQYTFVTRIEGAQLALNRPEEKDEQSEEFQKFLEQKRNAKKAEANRAEIMKKRNEFDKRFQSGMKSAEEDK